MGIWSQPVPLIPSGRLTHDRSVREKKLKAERGRRLIREKSPDSGAGRLGPYEKKADENNPAGSRPRAAVEAVAGGDWTEEGEDKREGLVLGAENASISEETQTGGCGSLGCHDGGVRRREAATRGELMARKTRRRACGQVAFTHSPAGSCFLQLPRVGWRF